MQVSPIPGVHFGIIPRIRRLVNDGVYRTILDRISEAEQQALERLLEPEQGSVSTDFQRIKEAPKSATLTHLDEWLSRLIWLQSLGNTERLVAGIRLAKITHLAEEARALHATNLWDFTAPKRLALLVCLIHQATIKTRDEIVQLFMKRIGKLTNRAKQELERLCKEERATTEHLIEVFADVLQTSTETQDPVETSTQIRDVLEQAGGAARLLEQCEQESRAPRRSLPAVPEAVLRQSSASPVPSPQDTGLPFYHLRSNVDLGHELHAGERAESEDLPGSDHRPALCQRQVAAHRDGAAQTQKLVSSPAPGNVRLFLPGGRTQSRRPLCQWLRAVRRLPRPAPLVGGM